MKELAWAINKDFIVEKEVPVILTGNSAAKAISLLLSKGVPESNIIFLNLIAVSLAQKHAFHPFE